MQNPLKSNEWQRIWVEKTFKIEKQKRGPNNSDILQNCFPQKIRSPLLILYKFQDFEKRLLHSCRMDWNLMEDEEFGFIELLRLKYRRGDQIIQTFCKIGSPHKLCPPSLIWGNYRTVRNVLLNHAEYIKMQWMSKNLGLENF